MNIGGLVMRKKDLFHWLCQFMQVLFWRLFVSLIIVVMIIGVLAVKLSAPGTVHNNSQHIVFAQRLDRSRD
jgi:hypothetical protein